MSSAILGAVALVRREPVPRGRDMLAIAAYGVLWLGVYSVTLNCLPAVRPRPRNGGCACWPLAAACAWPGSSLPDSGERTRLPTGMIMPGLPKPELCTDDRAKRPGAVTKPPARPAQATGPASSPP